MQATIILKPGAARNSQPDFTGLLWFALWAICMKSVIPWGHLRFCGTFIAVEVNGHRTLPRHLPRQILPGERRYPFVGGKWNPCAPGWFDGGNALWCARLEIDYRGGL